MCYPAYMNHVLNLYSFNINVLCLLLFSFVKYAGVYPKKSKILCGGASDHFPLGSENSILIPNPPWDR